MTHVTASGASAVGFHGGVSRLPQGVRRGRWRARADARDRAVRRRAAAARLRHQRPAGLRRARRAAALRATGSRRAAIVASRPGPLAIRSADAAAGDAAASRSAGRSRSCTTRAAASYAGDGVHRHARGARRRVRAHRSGARPRHHPGQHQSPRARADDHRPQLPGEDQRQHRQLRRALVDRGRSREAALGDALGRRHGDGSVDRQGHPRDARVDPAQLAGADRHGADLPGAREGRRPARGADLGDLPRHADRAGRAGRRLLHRARRRAAALHPADGAARDRHRLARRIDHRQVVPGAPPGELPLHALPRDLRDHAGLRRVVLARRRAAARLDCRRQRRGAVRRAEDAGRADAHRLGVRRPGDERGARATCRCTSSARTWRSSSSGAARRRSTRSAR